MRTITERLVSRRATTAECNRLLTTQIERVTLTIIQYERSGNEDRPIWSEVNFDVSHVIILFFNLEEIEQRFYFRVRDPGKQFSNPRLWELPAERYLPPEFPLLQPFDPVTMPQDADATHEEKTTESARTRGRFAIYMAISFCSLQGLTALFHEVLELGKPVSFWIALVLVSTQNFFLLMYYVYRTSHEHQLQQFMKYAQSIVGFRLWEAVLFYLLEAIVGLNYQLVAAIAQGQSIFLKFIVYKKLVFKTHRRPTVEDLATADVPPDAADE